MSLSSSLNIALSGLNVTQRGIDVTAGNIANAETEGFTRKTISQTSLSSQDRVIGVRSGNVERVLDAQVQSQLRTVAGENVNNQIQSDFLGRLDVAFGQPGSPTAIDTTFNSALASLEALSTTPENFNAQLQAVSDLRVFTSQLNSLSDTIQQLRREADIGIADSVSQANNALQALEDINGQILANGAGNTAFLQDDRDRLIDELSQIVDINVQEFENGGVNIQTTTGITLFSARAFELEFTQAGTVVPETSRENGTLDTVTVSFGSSTVIQDLFGPSGAQEGALAAYGQLRDTTLVQAQAQLDEFVAQLSLAISNNEVAATAIADGQQVDTAGAQDGNTVSLSFTNTAGAAQNVTLVQVDNPSNLPVDQDFTANPNDIVIGVNFNSATAAADIQAALNTLSPANGVIVGNVGSTFSFAAPGAANVDELSASITNSGFTNGLPFTLFQDGDFGAAFTNSPGNANSTTGFAQRVQVSQAIIDDPSLLSRFNAGNQNTGDSSRVDFVLDRIRNNQQTYSPSTGIGTPSNPVQATSADFLQTIISTQGQRSASAASRADASQVSFNNVQDRIQSESSVNIDRELANLIELEQAFQANARILSTVQDLFDTLFAAV